MQRTWFIALTIILVACNEPQPTTATDAADQPVAPAETAATTNDQAGSVVAAATSPEAAFRQKYPQAQGLSWERDDHGYHEAHFELDGEKYRADFTDDGTWIETERSVDYGDLPAAVKQVVKDQYDKDDVEEAEYVDNAEKGIFYDVEIKEKGKKFDVMITPDGRVLGREE